MQEFFRDWNLLRPWSINLLKHQHSRQSDHQFDYDTDWLLGYSKIYSCARRHCGRPECRRQFKWMVGSKVTSWKDHATILRLWRQRRHFVDYTRGCHSLVRSLSVARFALDIGELAKDCLLGLRGDCSRLRRLSVERMFPIIKNLWTSSFVLVSSGWSLILLAVFYAVIDVIGLKRWSMIFVIVGMNAITIYVAQRFIDFKHMSQFFLAGVARISGYEATVLLAGTLLFKMLFLWFLYSRKIFLRV